jgi:putative transposase
MTATLPDLAAKKKPAGQSAEDQAAAELVRQAPERGLSLTGPDGLLKQLTKTVIETALQEEMTEHLGYEKHDPAGARTGNIRNGCGRRSCSPNTADRSRSMCLGIGRAASSRRSSRSGNAASMASTRSPFPVCEGADHRRDPRALRRDLRRLGQQGDHLEDHRSGARGDERVGRPPAG